MPPAPPPIPELTPVNAVDYLNDAFSELQLAEAADKAHRLDDALLHYGAALTRLNAFLASPIAAMLGKGGIVNPIEIQQIVPGVRLRYERLTKARTIRDAPAAPPVPGAIPLTGPGAVASLQPEVAQSVAERAAAAAAAAGAAEDSDEARREAARKLEAELLQAAGLGAARSGGDAGAGGEGSRGAAGGGAGEGRGGEAAGPAASGSAAACEDLAGSATQRCAACGLAGRWSEAAASDGGDTGGGAAGGLPSLSRCGRCRRVFYCSPQCQRKHWPSHKPACRA
ncbi:hypothetical protein HYH03_000259 [Edaphochlamys debaryana]|uniref:MYND-type domain-containing protein n=1 Tax=Edaphochlamys debaryana TaxID=47281 RepID=A0A836C790_9CHLO|nr:hypothetical protein HYH03_000259 [Edaphochlamys debaryana]|eukprot:KAG2501759.1 hypothetical protein HYH03_000259 [Edaphochlamys debaryana]